jgi:hypothetical protein
MKIYIYGSVTAVEGAAYDYKIGKTSKHLAQRAGQRMGEHFAKKFGAEETLLVAFNSDAAVEKNLHNHFARLRVDGEYFRPDRELDEYIFWLRHQTFSWLNEDDGPDDQVHWLDVCPLSDRRMALPVSDALISEEDSYPPAEGTLDLRGTIWSRFAIYRPPWNDYYTPPWIISAVRAGMGGIDLDAASHWSANRVHQIPRYFSKQDDAHRQEWTGRVWLNPPYKNNQPWIDDILKHWSSGAVSQIAWLSPSYVFNKQQAQPVMDLASLVICLTCPTDNMFWGHGGPTKTRPRDIWCPVDQPALGVNQPHWIVYLGNRHTAVADAFLATGKGYPMLPYERRT